MNPILPPAYGAAQALVPKDIAGAGQSAEVPRLATQTVSAFRSALEAAETSALGTAVAGADPHAMVEAMAAAEMALDTAVTIRDRIVEAYQELLRMPI